LLSFFLDRYERRGERERERERDKKRARKATRKEEMGVAAGSPEALIVSEFRVDGNPPGGSSPSGLSSPVPQYTYVYSSFVRNCGEGGRAKI